MEIIVIATIIVLFFVFVLIKDAVKSLLGISLCAICVAVSATWIVFLFLNVLEIYELDPAMLGILIGGSVVGIMYQSEKYFKKTKLKHFWLIRLEIISFGFLIAYYLITNQWEYLMLVSIVASVSGTFSFILISQKQNSKEEHKDDKHFKDIGKRLENCCS